MQLHGFFRSSAAWRVRIALNLKGIVFETVPHHLLKGGQRAPEYLDRNPQGLVPALEDEGEIFTQSMAIIEYLDETQPHPPLLPGHPGDRARVRALAQIVACDIHPLNNLRVLRVMKHELGLAQPAIDAWQTRWISDGFAALERLLADDDRTGRFCQGDMPGLADIFLVPQMTNARRIAVPLAGFPTLLRIEAACEALEAFRRAHPDAQPDRE